MSSEINKSVPIPLPVIPVIESSKEAPRIAHITKEPVTAKAQTISPPEPKALSVADKKAFETTLSGPKHSDQLSGSEIKSLVGEIASTTLNSDRDSARQEASSKKVSFDFDDEEALTNFANKEWAFNAGAEIALNDHFEEKFASV